MIARGSLGPGALYYYLLHIAQDRQPVIIYGNIPIPQDPSSNSVMLWDIKVAIITIAIMYLYMVFIPFI